MQESKINSTLKISLLMVQVDGDRSYIAPALRSAPTFGGIAGIVANEQVDDEAGRKCFHNSQILYRPCRLTRAQLRQAYPSLEILLRYKTSTGALLRPLGAGYRSSRPPMRVSKTSSPAETAGSRVMTPAPRTRRTTPGSPAREPSGPATCGASPAAIISPPTITVRDTTCDRAAVQAIRVH